MNGLSKNGVWNRTPKLWWCHQEWNTSIIRFGLSTFGFLCKQTYNVVSGSIYYAIDTVVFIQITHLYIEIISIWYPGGKWQNFVLMKFHLLELSHMSMKWKYKCFLCNILLKTHIDETSYHNPKVLTKNNTNYNTKGKKRGYGGEIITTTIKLKERNWETPINGQYRIKIETTRA